MSEPVEVVSVVVFAAVVVLVVAVVVDLDHVQRCCRTCS